MPGLADGDAVSDGGDEVHIVDNYLRRRAHEEVGTDTLVPILGSLPERAAAWNGATGIARAACPTVRGSSRSLAFNEAENVAAVIKQIPQPILACDADYVNGSRSLGSFERESLVRHPGVQLFSRIITILTGRRITDPSSGHRAARADLLERVVLKQDQFWSTEILIEALHHRARVVEVPVTFLARAGGESKRPKSLRYGWNFLKVIIQTWLR